MKDTFLIIDIFVTKEFFGLSIVYYILQILGSKFSLFIGIDGANQVGVGVFYSKTAIKKNLI